MLAVTHRRRHSQAGVTFLELAIVLTIVGVLAALAVPSIIDRWQRETVEFLAQRLASTVSLAQATAQRRHVRTQLGPRENASWATGWALTELPLAAPDGTPSSNGRKLIAVALPTMPAVSLTTNLGRGTLSYEAVGYSRMSDVNGATLTLTCGRHRRNVVINAVGRPRICDPATSRGRCTDTADDDP
ncbi:pilus assembly protein [Ralstonia pickettii]|nr:pilus assembly protein [Ralstonia pickettii]